MIGRVTGARTRTADAAMARFRGRMAKLGTEARTARLAMGWSQQQVARRAGVSQPTVSRCEAGDSSLGAAAVACVLAAVGLDLAYRTFPEGLQLRDSGQLPLAQQLRGWAYRSWKIGFEVPVSDGSQRAADIVLGGPVSAIHVELESNLVDFQAQLRSGLLKRDALQERLGHPVAFVMALRDTERNRSAVRAYAGVISAALPAGSREVLSAIRNGRPLGRDGLLWLRSRSSAAATAEILT